MRRDCFEILEYARALRFNVKLKTNAVMIGVREAARLRRLGIEQVQISIYSDRPEIHDAITKVPGSLRRSLAAISHLKAAGVKVSISNVLMKHNAASGKAVHRLAKEIGVEFHIDPTITPMINGDRSILNLSISKEELDEVFHTEEFIGNVGEFCAPIADVDDNVLEGYSCSAGHTLAYISPSGDVFPCVQFPMPCGNLREKSFREIWYRSDALTELRSVQVETPAHMLTMRPYCLLHALPRPGLHGRKHARSIQLRLRKVRSAHRNPQCVAGKVRRASWAHSGSNQGCITATLSQPRRDELVRQPQNPQPWVERRQNRRQPEHLKVLHRGTKETPCQQAQAVRQILT